MPLEFLKDKEMNNNKKTENKGISALKKGRRKLLRVVFSRTGMIVLSLLVQIVLIICIFLSFGDYVAHIFSIYTVFSLIMVLVLLNSRTDPTSKITWLIVIAILPVFGALLYAYTQSDLGHRALKNKVNSIIESTKNTLKRYESADCTILKNEPGIFAMVNYVGKCGCHPLYDNSKATYIKSGKEKFDALIKQLEAAEKYIFLEYFIINRGYMWDNILEILKRKASDGVDVRVMYDGTCEFSLLPHSYPAELKKYGIKCKIFAPITPFLSTHYNYRDHRKIAVIDGNVAFTGGINLSDEYMNIASPFGEWKDASLMIEGPAASSFALMFLQMWSLDEKKYNISEFAENIQANPNIHADGFIMPYSDSPLDGDKVGESVYIDILNRARTSVRIMTPYLILDSVMEHALKYAAERGVEVSVVLPGIPDKKAPYALAKTHYASLIDSGVNIYEYTPGFVHAKVMCADSREAVVGTINMDYRSFYHHFECAAYIYGSDCIKDISDDFDDVISKSRKITKESLKNIPLRVRLHGVLLKAIAPLM